MYLRQGLWSNWYHGLPCGVFVKQLLTGKDSCFLSAPQKRFPSVHFMFALLEAHMDKCNLNYS